MQQLLHRPRPEPNTRRAVNLSGSGQLPLLEDQSFFSFVFSLFSWSFRPTIYVYMYNPTAPPFTQFSSLINYTMCNHERIIYEDCQHRFLRLISHCHFARNDPFHQCWGVRAIKRLRRIIGEKCPGCNYC